MEPLPEELVGKATSFTGLTCARRLPLRPGLELAQHLEADPEKLGVAHAELLSLGPLLWRQKHGGGGAPLAFRERLPT